MFILLSSPRLCQVTNNWNNYLSRESLDCLEFIVISCTEWICAILRCTDSHVMFLLFKVKSLTCDYSIWRQEVSLASWCITVGLELLEALHGFRKLWYEGFWSTHLTWVVSEWLQRAQNRRSFRGWVRLIKAVIPLGDHLKALMPRLVKFWKLEALPMYRGHYRTFGRVWSVIHTVTIIFTVRLGFGFFRFLPLFCLHSRSLSKFFVVWNRKSEIHKWVEFAQLQSSLVPHAEHSYGFLVLWKLLPVLFVVLKEG